MRSRIRLRMRPQRRRRKTVIKIDVAKDEAKNEKTEEEGIDE